MSNDSNDSGVKALLRQARARLRRPPLHPFEMSGADQQKLLHELQVHQVELELQNEELRRAQAELEASRVLYFELYDLAPVGYCTVDEGGRILHANLSAAAMLGVTREALVGRSILQSVPAEDHEVFLGHRAQLFATGTQQTCDLRLQKEGGGTFWVRLRSVCSPDAEGARLCRVAIIDITESRLAEEALREQKEFFHQIAENLSDFIAVVDLEGRRIYNSPSYQRFFGTTEGLRNSDSFAEVHPEDRERVKRVFRETVASGTGHRIEYRFLMADGSVRDMESNGSVIRDRDGQIVRVLIVSHDITERRRLQEQVRHMAFHDALTGLPNRRLFGDRLSQAMAANTRNACYGALMFLDMDNFKPLNDAHGHDAGDLLLIEAAERLRRCVREMDTVARFGGDEFVVMLSPLARDKAASTDEAGIVAEKLRSALSEPFRLTVTQTGQRPTVIEHRCTASIGVAVFDDTDASAGDILKRADSAMYLAKQAGGNQVRVVGTERRRG